MLNISGITIQAQIYESANSLVYRGLRDEDSQPIILKILKENYPTPQELARYRTEYQITKSLNLPGIVKVYDLQKYQNTLVMLLEDFGGESLKLWSQQCRFTLVEFLSIAIKVTETLGQIHAANIIHKDINPSNIIFNRSTGELKIIDFSISTQLIRENTTLKNPNILEGTLAYISPEQTGRMNRPLDYRTDFYSLGITFYELLTNQLPFTTNDALELVHCHIAKQPLTPSQLNPEIPQIISEIVMKLIAKNAEKRYQSAVVIQADLAECLRQLETHKNISNFTLSRQDISDKFQISQKLYGRESEIETLLTAFERVSSSQSELMLIAGYSGIGKSVLVQELYKPITEKRGYFISGKFDQFQRNIPYSAVVSAFQELIKQLLTETENQLNQWRDQLLAAVGINGQVIVEIIPEIELIIGKQPSLLELGPNESQNRFNLVLQNFIKVFTKPAHPLALFLDDLQWADGASLKLMQLLMSASTPGLFLIGAYRDNEVSAVHPFMLTIDEIAKIGATINRISLSPLDLETATKLISETVKSEGEMVKTLAELVLFKTGGNPFFINEFLKSLYTEKLLKFDFSNVQWQWNLEKIQARGFTDNVVELMAEKIQKLPESTQNILKLAACIGNQFDLKTLGLIEAKSLAEIVNNLQVAVAENLIFPVSNKEDIELEIATTEFLSYSVPNTSSESIEYKFAHDRIQQAAYSLIPDHQKPTTHYQIGQLLLQQISPETREENIFKLVNQLNYGTCLITEQTERNELAQLNLIACHKARAATAYQAAYEYAIVGLSLLGEKSWQQDYEITLKLHELAAELAFLCSDFEQMEYFIDIVIKQARSVLEQVKVYQIKIQSHASQNKLLEAIGIGQQILQQFGITFPASPTPTDAQQAIQEIRELIGDRKIEDLVNLPVMTDGEKLAIVQITNSIIPSAFNAGSPLFLLLSCLTVKLSIQYGNTLNSAHSYANYGIILCNFSQDVTTATQFGQLALNVLYKLNAINVKAAVLTVLGLFIRHRKCHIRETLPLLQEAYTTGLEIGHFEYSGYSTYGFLLASFWCGQPLANLEQDIRNYANQLVKLNQLTTANYCRIYWQSVLSLLGVTEHPTIFSGEAIQETDILPQLLSKNDLLGVYFFYLYKLMLCFLFGEIDQAQNYALEGRRYLMGGAGLISEVVFYFYDSLIILAQFNPPTEETSAALNSVRQNQTKLQKHWADYAPMNYQHKVDLVEAEKCRVLGQKLEAMDLYDRAIKGAKENEYINEAALAYELAAKFYLSQGKDLTAKAYMQEARYHYQIWGATAKVKDLEKRYSQLLTTTQGTTKEIQVTATVTSTGSASNLDIATVLKATSTISGEIVLDKLLSSLMKILIENAGAQTGYLILSSQGNDGKTTTLQIEAQGTIDSELVTVLQSISVTNTQFISEAIVNYVARTQESVVLNDATKEGKFTNDPYVKRHQPKSILCVPLINQGKLISIVYLENNLTVGAFTPDRLEVLKLLSSQAAISIENANLYTQLEESNRTLEQKVEERTIELADANQEITILNQRLKAENVRMSAELDVIRKLQQMILPKEEEITEIEGLEIAGFMEPADEVGGDYYDVLQQAGKVKIAIGDVTGHGLEAGMLMIMAQTAVRTLLESNETNPVKFLDILNHTLYKNVSRMNSDKNMTLALLDYSQGTVTISGQHEEVIVVRADGELELIDTMDLGLPIALDSDIADFISQTQVQLHPGDGVVLYTDGITEAFNMMKQQYGLERLCEVVRDSWHKSVREIRQAVIEDVRRHIGEQKVYDDITLVVLKQT